jgi:hypothetical protein
MRAGQEGPVLLGSVVRGLSQTDAVGETALLGMASGKNMRTTGDASLCRDSMSTDFAVIKLVQRRIPKFEPTPGEPVLELDLNRLLSARTEGSNSADVIVRNGKAVGPIPTSSAIFPALADLPHAVLLTNRAALTLKGMLDRPHRW